MSRALLVLLLAGGAAAAPVPKALKARPPSLDGRWETVERVNRGKAISEKWVWEVSGEQLVPYSQARGGVLRPTYEGATLTLAPPDPARPDELDYRYTAGNSRLVYRGRVKWDGDEWVFCFGEAGAERPAEVKAGDGVYYFRFKRVEAK